MPLKQDEAKGKEVCQVHGAPASSGNRMLIGMLLASLLLIAWHIAIYGPSSHLKASGPTAVSFPMLLGNELWDLLSGNKGIIAELVEVMPYFLIGILIAGYLRTYKVAVKLQATLRKYGVASVFIASLVGIITPLCACGTLTTAISLLFAGIPLAPIMSLMITSPLLSPSAYLLTLNDLGPEWTVVRTISAFSFGVFAGLVTYLVSRRGGFGKNEIFIEGSIIRGDFHDDDYPDERLRCNCRRNFGNRVAVRTGNTFLIFLAKSSEMLWLVGKYVIVGVTIGAVVERYIPGEWIYRFFGHTESFNILWVTLASVPLFLHQISASSILYHIKGSLGGTLDCGAALAFMIGGPVTAVPTMVLFWTFFKKRVFVVYMAICIVGTLLISYLFQLCVFVPGVDLGNPLLKGVTSLSGGVSRYLVKQSPNVRMVMDPSGKGLIASYTNDVEGGGGIVFDASRDRFSRGSADRYDNQRYIANIAGWLEQNSNASTRKSILVYDLSDDTGDNGASSLLGDGVLSRLREKGFTVRVAGRRELPVISGRTLTDYGQLWLFFAPPGSGIPLRETEMKLVADFNAGGNGILCVPSIPQAAEDGTQEVNRFSSRFGVRFVGSFEQGKEVKVSTAPLILFDHASEWLGRMLKVVRKA